MNHVDDFEEANPDPMQEPYWTLAMMTAWVLWRNPQQVSERWHINFEKHGFPHAQSMNDVLGNAASQERDQSMSGGSTDWPTLLVGAKEASIAIRRALAALILADGYSPGGNDRVPVTSRDLEAIAIEPYADAHRSASAKARWHDALFLRGASEPFLEGVRVARSDVQRVWPDPHAAPVVDVEGEAVDVGTDVVQPVGSAIEAETAPQPADDPETLTIQSQTMEPEIEPHDVSADAHFVDRRNTDPDRLIEEIKADLEARIPPSSQPDVKRFEAMIYILKLAATGGDPCRQRRDAPTEMDQIRISGFRRTTYREAYGRIPPDLFDKYYKRHRATLGDTKKH